MDSAVRRTREGFTTHVEPTTTSESDEGRELLPRIATCDPEAMREFYLLYHLRLTRFLARITAHRELVARIVDDVFIAVWQRAAEFSYDLRVSTWVMRIAWRQALQSVRLVEYLAPYATDPPDFDTPSPGSRPALERAMDILSGYERALIELAYVGGYSCEEISIIMACPASTVRMRLYDARLRLRVELQKGVSPDGTALESMTPEAWPTTDCALSI
jgi:RNA polymerase sigma factor (sigma-70 family)